MSDIRDTTNRLFAKIRTKPHVLYIFDHPAALLNLSPAIEKDLYRITDPRLADPFQFEKIDDYTDLSVTHIAEAIFSDRPVILLDYNAAIAKILELVVHSVESEYGLCWPVFAFFFNDTETAQTLNKDHENCLESKVDILTDMTYFNYIKKIEVPKNHPLTLSELFNYAAQSVNPYE